MSSPSIKSRRAQAFATNHAGRRVRTPTGVEGTVAGWAIGDVSTVIIDLTGTSSLSGWHLGVPSSNNFDHWVVPPGQSHRYWYVNLEGLVLIDELGGPT
jgi:hypothetical protein